MTTAPPPFAERKECSGCRKAFTFLLRRHHCRNCGDSFCASCAPHYDPLPHFGFTNPERTCAMCHEHLRKTQHVDDDSRQPSITERPSLDEAFGNKAIARSRADNRFDDSDDEDELKSGSAATRINCTCGMPLCICSKQSASKANVQVNISKPRPATTTTPNDAASANTASAAPRAPPKPFVGFPSMMASKAAVKVDPNQDINEQCREAIKNGQLELVKELIEAKASMSYVDRSGNTLLHMACIMDKLPIITALVEAGAHPYVVNSMSSANETPYDVASPSVQFRLKQLVPPPQSSSQ